MDAKYSDEPPVRMFERWKNHARLAKKAVRYEAVVKVPLRGSFISLAFRS